MERQQSCMALLPSRSELLTGGGGGANRSVPASKVHFFPLGTNRDRGGPQRAFFDLFRAFAYMNVIKTFICPFLCGHVFLSFVGIFMPAGSVLRTPGLESSCCILSHGPPDFLSCGEKATKSAAPIDTVSVSGF